MDNAIEIMVAVVIIIMITGIFLASFEDACERIVSLNERENANHLVSEIADGLINNPGSPDNWHEIGKGKPGLAIINEGGEAIPNSISWQKFSALSENYRNFIYEKTFDSKFKSSMELIPQKSSVSSVKIGSSDEGDIIYSVTRLVMCDFYKKYVMKDFTIDGKCNHAHPQDEYSCGYFKIFKGNLKRSDYYLLIDSSEKYDLKYLVDTTRVVKARDFQTAMSEKIHLNDRINFYDDTSAVVFVHFDKPHAKAVLVSVPKNFDKNRLKYDYFRTNECEFILKAWY